MGVSFSLDVIFESSISQFQNKYKLTIRDNYLKTQLKFTTQNIFILIFADLFDDIIYFDIIFLSSTPIVLMLFQYFQKLQFCIIKSYQTKHLIQFFQEIMLSEFAYAKFQTINGEEHFVRQLPALIGSKRYKQWTSVFQANSSNYKDPHNLINNSTVQCLTITNICWTFPIHCLLYYDEKQEEYKMIGISGVKVDDQSIEENQAAIQILSNSKNPCAQLIHKEGHNAVSLSNINKITFESEDKNQSQLLYFCLPLSTLQRINQAKQNMPSISLTPDIQPISTNGSKWSNDDHEQLKKLLLQYGYGRWKQIQRSSASLGGKLDSKPLAQVKAYANSFVRALGLSLPEEQTSLKIFLQKLIQQNNQQFLEFQPNLKQWDQHIMFPQRSIQYTKRLQLLNRVKTLIRKYREDAMRNMVVKDRRKINWDGLLNFIPSPLLFGQRPVQWWARKHDVDLLLGVYKYGYANYVSIRSAKQYCFSQIQKNQTYHQIPVADNLTRRLKKLINTIVKIQQQGQIDFQDDAESEQDQKTWSDNEKKVLFSILIDFGVPMTNDNRPNWGELKDKLKNQLKQINKTPGQVQKMVSRIRWNCQEIVSDQKAKEQISSSQANSNAPFKIYYDQAVKFCRNMNILQFVRRTILTLQQENLKNLYKQLQQKAETLPRDHPAYTDNKTIDTQILNHVNKHGITPNSQLKLSESKVLARIQWICEVFKQTKQKLNEKKKKYKPYDDSIKKKAKFEITRDKEGNIKFPININPSLILVATGRINIEPSYHSEHNLFPIGYVSIRTHASMFQKGVRAKYRCEILEGDGRPIYKVTPQQDPEHPIIRDSSTGCWVYICQKVNNLQQVKKQKVTISGTERFGLLQPNVVRLLEDLPDAEKCSKYKFKRNLPQTMSGNKE